MLYLMMQEQGGNLFYLFQDKEYVIGRKNADIEFSDDQSISRKHAVINTRGNTITLCESGSKYGTQHNNVKLTANVEVTLDNNDLIKFGMFKNKYRIKKIPIVTTSSTLTPEEKCELKTNLEQLGATFVSHWDASCTHLTANAIMLTIKVLHALVDKRPIVAPKYWNEFLVNIRDRKLPPTVEDFKPPITENLINAADFPVEADRTQLFRGKIFVFAFDKTRKKMAELIKKTGGCSISWEKQQVSLLEVTKSKNYLFIYEDFNSDSQKDKNIPKELQDIWKHLEKLGERTIPLQEIAMAVVQNSCEKDCNPKFNRIDNVFNVITPETETGAVSLAQNTPSDCGLDHPEVAKRELVIPESLEPEFDVLPTPRVTQSASKNLPSTSKDVDVSKNTNGGKRTPLSVSNVFAVPKSIPSTSRHAEDPSNDNPPKRMKLDDAKEKEKQSDTQSESRGRKLSGNPFGVVAKTEPECRKRKADEPVPSARKKTERANPFAFLKRQKNDSQSAFKVKEEDTADGDNPFLEILSGRSRSSSVQQVEEVVAASTQKYETQSYEPSDVSGITWMTTKNPVICKFEDVDPEFQEMFEMFKDTVVIEPVAVSFVRAVTPFCSPVSPDNSIERKNFKKFKKVPPRHPQTTILVTSFQALPLPEEVAVLSDDENVPDEEIPEVEVRRPTKKSSTFVF